MSRVLLVVSFVLLIQFLLGMAVNLFVTISNTHPGAGAADYFVGAAQSVGWAVAHEWPYLALHALLGIALVVTSLTFFVQGLAAHRPTPILVTGGTGVFGALLAAGSGMYFLVHPDVDLASLLMATGFAIALGAVTVQLFLVRWAAAMMAAGRQRDNGSA